MPSPELDNLVRIGRLKEEPPSHSELEGLIRSGSARLEDAARTELSPESRFDLVYNAAHALALVALRWHGYRSDSRYLVFQALPHTLGLPPATWRLFAKAHEQRNLSEYEGVAEVDERLLADLLAATRELLEAVQKLHTGSKSEPIE